MVLLNFIYPEDESERVFHLKNGDKISGHVLSYDSVNNSYSVKTKFGIVTLKKSDLLVQEVVITLINGDRLVGELILETEEYITVKTAYGVIDVEQTTIDHLKFKSNIDAAVSKVLNTKKTFDDLYFFADEELIDIYFDPTGFTLDKNTLYFSGLSVGYGVSDRFQITTKYWESIYGGLNFRVKYKLYERGDLNQKSALSVGSHIHTWGRPSLFYTTTDENGEDTYLQIGEENLHDNKLWGEVFLAHTFSRLKKSKQGRLGWTHGGLLTFYPNYDVMPRLYSAVDYDLRHDLKFIFELFYDPYWSNGISSDDFFGDFHLDYGLMYTVNENLRLGIHIQRPFFAFYYKY